MTITNEQQPCWVIGCIDPETGLVRPGTVEVMEQAMTAPPTWNVVLKCVFHAAGNSDDPIET